MFMFLFKGCVYAYVYVCLCAYVYVCLCARDEEGKKKAVVYATYLFKRCVYAFVYVCVVCGCVIRKQH